MEKVKVRVKVLEPEKVDPVKVRVRIKESESQKKSLAIKKALNKVLHQINILHKERDKLFCRLRNEVAKESKRS